MKQQEIRTIQEQSAIQLRPIISYPRTAEAGENYLLTIDVQLADDSSWPYQEEEFEISFILETEPFFTHDPLGEHEPGIVLHRYGGTYGAAEYLLTASSQTVALGYIKITMLNGWGLPIAQLELECEVQQQVALAAKKKAVRKVKTGQISVPTNSSTSSTPVPPEEPPTRTSEQRDLVTKELALIGWKVLYADELRRGNTNPKLVIPSGNIALHGYQSMESDYLLFIEQEVIGLVKVHPQGTPLTDHLEVIALQALLESGISQVKFVKFRNMTWRLRHDVPFIYHTTGYETIFINYFEPGQDSRRVYTFHQPSTFITWLNEASRNPNSLLRARLLNMPILEQGQLFDIQYEALQRIEQSLVANNTRTLIHIETGRGKTHIAIRCVSRLLAFANAKHIFYVVDMSLAKQYALDAFQRLRIEQPSSPTGTASFIERYEVRAISGERLDPAVHVYIGTLEDLYLLYASGKEGECLPAPKNNDSASGAVSSARSTRDYCADLPIEYFDVIVLAESEHIDYQFWQPLLDYFDAFYIGIASSLKAEVLSFFNKHLVYQTTDASREEQDNQLATSSARDELIATMKSARDLLRKDAGLSGDTDRLPQLVWLLLLKYLDDYEYIQEKLLGGDYIPVLDEGYRWRDWVVAESLTHRRKGEELLKFVNDDLIPYLASLESTKYRDLRTIISTIFSSTHNRIRSGYILRDVIDKLNMINFNSSDDARMIALYYETLLKDIRDSAGDSGEFYTPRPVVRFIIDSLNPQLGESLLDPACGTAGFLVEAYEHLQGQVRTPEQRQQLQENLIGIEKKSTPYLLGAMNMLLYGIDVPNITLSNALVTNLQQLQDKDFVDIIATIPPFGGEEERSVINNFPDGMRTVETALLFFQYIMQTLKRPGGRCGVVLPNGFLFGNNVASRIKRQLLTQFNLHTIVRLPNGVFAPYTTIPTNILFFEASEYLNSVGRATLTEEVWYYEIPLPEGQRSYTKTKPIQYKDFHDCISWWDQREENEHAWKVPVEQLFANDCNLDVKNPGNE